MPAYLTLQEFKAAVEIADTVDDADIQRALNAGGEWIDFWCGRSFGAVGASTTRTYTATLEDRLDVDDVAAVTAVAIDVNGDGTFSGVLSPGHWQLYPLEVGQPGVVGNYTQLRLTASAPYAFVPGNQARVTGGYGFPAPAPPAAIAQANLILSNRWFQRPHAPFGIQEAPQSGELARIGEMDPDVALLLGPYVASGSAGAAASEGAGAVGAAHWVIV